MVVNKTVIKGNWNIVPYTDINIGAQVHAKKPKAISAFAAGMTVIFSQRNYSANVLLLNGDWKFDTVVSLMVWCTSWQYFCYSN